MDREKVIKGLHQHCEGSMFDRCGECPYYEIDHEPFICRDMLLNDLNALLKQEAVKPKKADNPEESEYCCGICGYPLWLDELYCAHCGRRVLWEGR